MKAETVVVLLVVRTVSFLLESLYRRFCYPISWYGFFMFWMRESTPCKTLGNVTMFLDTYTVTVVSTLIVRFSVFCANQLKSQKKVI